MTKRKTTLSTTSRADGDPGSLPARQPVVVGPVTEIRRASRHAAGTAEELRAFLKELRGRSPKEMLGAVASSSLFQSLVTATIGAGILIVVLTLLPFAWERLTRSEASQTSLSSAAPGKPAPAPDTPAPPAAAQGEAAPAEGAAGSSPVPAPEILEKLGVGEERSAPPSANPLDDAGDDLLKGLD